MLDSLLVIARKRFALVVTGLVFGSGIVLTLGARTQASAATAPAAPVAVPVSVAVTQQTDVRTWDEFSGRIEAVNRVELRSRVAGPVQSVHFREGELVKKGELLITIDPEPFEAEVQRTQAEVAVANERLSYTTSEFQRAERLMNERAISQREHDAASNAYREAEATLKAAQAALQSARLNLGYTQIKAPVAGRVGRIDVTVGNLVAAGPTSPILTTLVSVDPIYASFDADEGVVADALGQIRSSASGARGSIDQIPVQITTLGNIAVPHQGHLQLVDNEVDARSGTVRVRAVFPNPDGTLMAGQFAKVQMGQVKIQPAILVAERALGSDQSKKYVMVVGTDNHAMYREVTLGARVDGMRIVTSGLAAHEQIIVNGLQRVQPGSLVAPTIVSMDAPPKPVTAGQAQKS